MATNIMDIGRYVQQGFEDGAERKRRNEGRRLMGLAAQGDREAVKQLYAVDPAAAQQAQQQQKAMHQEVANLMWRGATAIKQAPPEQKAAIYSAVRAEVAKHPQSLEWTAMLPEQYDPAQVDPAVDQLLAQTGLYQGQQGPTDQPAQLRFFDGLMQRAGYGQGSPEYNQAARIFANLDPKARAQIVESADGYNVVGFGGGNSPTSSPVMQGGQPPAASPPAQPDWSFPKKMSDNEILAIANKMSAGGAPKQAILNFINAQKFMPDMEEFAAIINQPSTPMQGNQLRPPKKESNVPSGYRLAPNGVDLVPIKGGPADKTGGSNIDSKAEMQLRKEYADLVKEPLSIITSYKKVQGAASNPTAAGDLSMIFAYMKMLDPTSVVRETEFANAQNAAGVPDRIQNVYNKVLRGERLNPAQRADFLAQAKKLADQSQETVSTYKKRYSSLASEYGMNEGRVTFDPNTIEDAEMTLPPLDGSGSVKRTRIKL